MKSLWNDAEAKKYAHDPVEMRAYSSRLLGQNPALVLHGGGNTSVKAKWTNLFGEEEELLYVKGSGHDLATIPKEGFAPVRLDVLLKMAKLSALTDSAMVKNQKAAMTNPGAPSPSVEAILHALIPYTYVDHTHTDAVVTLSNIEGGEAKIRELFGERVLVVPYAMPGFVLAKQIYEATQGANWDNLEGIVLLHHGVFTFANDAKESYERMIRLVTLVEDYLQSKDAFLPQADELKTGAQNDLALEDCLKLAKFRRQVSEKHGAAMIINVNSSDAAIAFSKLENVADFATRGCLTPDHVISTKRIPLVLSEEIESSVESYSENYKKYFERNTDGKLTCLDTAPRWAIWPGRGILSVGPNPKRTKIIRDITSHTACAFQWGEALGGWQALPEKDIFEVEYWELEQAKLKVGGPPKPMQGKVAIVTGAASGIGKACADSLRAEGVAVVALDIQDKIVDMFQGMDALGVVCDVTSSESIESAIRQAIQKFGGIDMVVSNAGSFPPGKKIQELDEDTWRKAIDVNLTSHQLLMHACVPYLLEGMNPSIVVIASKNVLAPGPGASAYSAAKAGLTQLARVAALELGPKGVRVNVLHPNAVFDTGIWTDEVLKNRAAHYGLSVDEYKRNNVLKVEVTSQDVADMVKAMTGPLFAKTTGAQIAIDGGNERII